MKKTNTHQIGTLPPQAVELEEAVLGALLLERDALIQTISILRPDHFYKQQHVKIFEAIATLFHAGDPVDLITVTTKLRAMGNLEIAGGAFYITELTSKVSSSANVEYHARIITEQWMKRQMISLAGQIQQAGFDDTADVFELMDKTQLQLINLMGGIISHRAIHLKSSVMDVMYEMQQNMTRNKSGQLTGIPTPIDSLNQLTGGWQKSDLVIIAARPAMGKTGFALCIARSAAKDKKSVLVFSLEMSHQKLTYRMIAQETRLKSVTEMQRGEITDIDLRSLTSATNSMTNYKIFIDDQASLSLMALRSKAMQMKSMNQLEMIVVDYLQLMQDQSAQQGNREQEISRISRGLKILAKDLEVPVIALSQLSRAVESRGGDKKPQLSDLRESGSIEQDADMVIFLYRPEYYGIGEMEYSGHGVVSTAGLATGIIAKHRNGPVGEFLMKFDSRYTDFTNFQTYQESDAESFDWSRVEKNF